MSEINANFIVEQSSVNIQTDNNVITVDTDPISLNVFALGFTSAGGQPGNIQFNDSGSLGGAANTVVSAGNVRFTNISNLKIANGSNGYFLQTDGTGNLTWAPGTVTANGNGTPVGANTQIQVTDGAGNFVSAPGFTFDNASNLFTVPGNAIITNNVNANIVTANYFIGDGTNISNINSNTIVVSNSNATSNTTYYPIFVSGIGNKQAEIDNSNNVLTYVPNSGTLNTNILDITQIKNSNGNINVNTNIDSLNIAANGNIAANYFIGNGDFTAVDVTGNITAGNANLGNNATANYFNGDGSNIQGVQSISNGTSIINIPVANGNINMSVGNTSNIVIVTANKFLLDTQTINLGNLSGSSNQESIAIAIGTEAGKNNQGYQGTAIGYWAARANQSSQGIAIGAQAAELGQGNSSIAIGHGAGKAYPTTADIQGSDSIAIGSAASANGSNTISIGGNSVAAANNTIVLNATSNLLTGNTANALFVKPIRNAAGTYVLNYDTFTGEITYQPNNTNKINNGNSKVEIAYNDGGVLIRSNTGAPNGAGILVGDPDIPGGTGSNITITAGGTLRVNSNLDFLGVGRSLQGGNLVSGETINFVTNLRSNQAALTRTSTTISHKVPIILNGVTYYICLTTSV